MAKASVFVGTCIDTRIFVGTFMSMRKLTRDKRVQLVNCLVDGCGINATSRLTGISKNAVLRFLLDIAQVCANHEDGAIRGVKCRAVEADELWGFAFCKDRHAPNAKVPNDEPVG